MTLTWEFPPFISGGLGMASYGLVKALLKQYIEVLLILPTHLPLYFQLKEPGDEDLLSPIFLSAELEKKYRPMRSASDKERLAFLGLASHPEIYGSRHDVYSADIFPKVHNYSAQVQRIASNIDYDMIHAHDWLTYPAASQLKVLSGKPLVCHVHSTEFDRAGEAGDAKVHMIEYCGLMRADRIVTVSQYTASMIEEKYRINPEKIRVVHNAYQIESNNTGKKRLFRSPVILFLGRITRQKGPDYFLELARRVIKQCPQVHFIMAGAGDMERDLIHRSGLYRFKTKFLFTGFLNRKEVCRILSISDIMVFPSISEPFGIAPLEAMRYGITTIISKQSGVSEIVKNVFKIDFWDIDRMVSTIVELLKNPVRMKLLGKTGMKEVKKIGWDSTGLLMKRVYRELVC